MTLASFFAPFSSLSSTQSKTPPAYKLPLKKNLLEKEGNQWPKKCSYYLLLFLLSTPLVLAAPTKTSNITLPPLPPKNQETEQVAIFMTEREMNEQEILGLTKKYPDIQLRTIFQYALKAFPQKDHHEVWKNWQRKFR